MFPGLRRETFRGDPDQADAVQETYVKLCRAWNEETLLQPPVIPGPNGPQAGKDQIKNANTALCNHPGEEAFSNYSNGSCTRKPTLSDRSILTINTDARVEVRMPEHRRQLILETGEMNIDVAHAPSRPLQAFVQGRVFEALGTQFHIRIDDSQHIELLITKGTPGHVAAVRGLFFTFDAFAD